MGARMIRDWTDSEKIEQLSVGAEVFFTRLIMKADDYGRFNANLLILRSMLFPLKLDVTPENIETWLKECSSAELVEVYESDGKRVVEIQNFDQRLRIKKSKFPGRGGNESIGYVYFIGSEDNQPVKIGFSLNPWSRAKEISTGNHSPLKVIACFKGDKNTEKEYHKAFSAYQSKNEWFSIPPEILKFICKFQKEDTAESVLTSLRSNYEILRRYLNSNTKENSNSNTELEGRRAPGFVDEKFKVPFLKWMEYKKKRRESYKTLESEEAFYKKLLKLSGENSEIASEIIEQSMAQNWAGIFELKTQTHGRTDANKVIDKRKDFGTGL